MGAFCSISEWHPAIARCEEQTVDGGAAPAAHHAGRRRLLEKLLEHDNDGMAYSYSIVESPLPVHDYRSTISVADEGGKARLTWRQQLRAEGALGGDAAKVIGGIYDAGLESIKAKVK
jgi:hypothetical protein